MGHKISKEQIDPSVKDHIMSFVGNKNELETSDKSDMINAINSLIVDRVDNAANMNKLANSIGTPVTGSDNVDEVCDKVNGLLSTFKTNMMNAGVVVENGDKFKALIDKIKGLTEGEGNKGIQFANGEGEWETVSVNSDYRVTIPTNLDFTPTYIFCLGVFEFHDNIYDSDTHVGNMVLSNIERGTGSNMSIGIIDITPESFTIDGYYQYNSGYNASRSATATIKSWYAIGVGEEDTTLRDSLASILENKGVDVTEEDDMASLISKTDNLIATLNDNALVLDSTFESGYDVSIFSSDGNYTSSTADWNLVLCIDVKRPGTYNCSFNAKTNSSGNMCTVDLYYPNTTEGNCIYSKSFSSTTAVTCSETFTFDTPGQLYFNLTCPVSYYQAILSDIVLKSKINL